MARRPLSPTPAGAPPADPKTALAYTSRLGDVWYLHEGVTKTGKPRYFVARTPGDGALSAMPAGREFGESINGVVSVARIDPYAPKILPADLAALQAEVRRHPHLARYKVDESKGALVLHEPHGMGSTDIAGFAAMLGLDLSELGPLPQSRVRYTAVLKFTPGARPDLWSVYRWVFRGKGSWHWIGHGSLAAIAKEYLPVVGTDAFFELI